MSLFSRYTPHNATRARCRTCGELVSIEPAARAAHDAFHGLAASIAEDIWRETMNGSGSLNDRPVGLLSGLLDAPEGRQ